MVNLGLVDFGLSGFEGLFFDLGGYCFGSKGSSVWDSVISPWSCVFKTDMVISFV